MSRTERIAFIGNYLPRQCGIATFTTDLCESVAAEFPDTLCIVVPVNDGDAEYAYPARVKFELREKDIESYRRAAEFLNINNIDLVCLQHEFGIFGGQSGSHILALLSELRMPVLTTFHTVLENPNPGQRRVMERVAALSNRVVVMSEQGVKFLREVYRIPERKIDCIPHGIPDVPFNHQRDHKALFGVEGKTVLLSFGLLSPDKGIENVILALPAVLARHPDVVYIVLGATHPHVKRNEGETYRLSLHRVAHEKGVEGGIIFYNRFVSREELNEFIGAADIYITPYLKAGQITSGTLAYTVGAGKAVISTPYGYARELLADGRGELVPFADPEALAARILELLDDEPRMLKMRQKAYASGREMIWPKVAARYKACFEQAIAEHQSMRITEYAVKPLGKRPAELPPLKLDHLLRMTDDTGILQHAVFTTPLYHEGYTTDDNARALIVGVFMEELGNGEAYALTLRYLAFLLYAFDAESGRFRNFMDFRRHWLEACGSEDSHGRALWALGSLLGRSSTAALRGTAARLLESALPAILETGSPRAWAFALIGIHEASRRYDLGESGKRIRAELADRLWAVYRQSHTEAWPWFEQQLTYCNAVLPHALLLCGHSLEHPEMTRAGLDSLEWLVKMHRPDPDGGHFVPIGSNGFYHRDGDRSRFDQQPVEAQAMVSACLEAQRLTGSAHWSKEARRAFDWFLGRNDLNLTVYDPTTGGCRDGLHADRPNENQGAESSLAFLQSLLELRLLENTISPHEVPSP